jgi:hypothetical protein
MFGIYTYAENTYVSITSLQSVVADIARLSELVQVSFDELEQKASAVNSVTRKPLAPARKRGAKRVAV